MYALHCNAIHESIYVDICLLQSFGNFDIFGDRIHAVKKKAEGLEEERLKWLFQTTRASEGRDMQRDRERDMERDMERHRET